MSPVNPKENGVSGITCDNPPPAADPLMFMVGPPEGWRKVAIDFCLRFAKPCTKPIAVVDLPLPNGVGLIALTFWR